MRGALLFGNDARPFGNERQVFIPVFLRIIGRSLADAGFERYSEFINERAHLFVIAQRQAVQSFVPPEKALVIITSAGRGACLQQFAAQSDGLENTQARSRSSREPVL